MITSQPITSEQIRAARALLPEEVKARYERIMGHARKIRSLPVLDPNFSLDDLYDENGLPK